MAGKTPHVFDGDGAKRIVNTVRTVENMVFEPPNSMPREGYLWQVQGKLLGDLAAGTSFDQNPSTASLQVYVPDLDPANNNQLIDAEYTITVTNRDPTLTKDTDDWVRCVFVNGEWQPHGGGAGNATIGVVKGYLGQGWHEIEVYEDPTPPTDPYENYYAGFGQATHSGGGTWTWDMALDLYENRVINPVLGSGPGGYGVDEYVGAWSGAAPYTGTKIVHTEAGDGTRTYWAACYPEAVDDGDVDQIAPGSPPANDNKDPNTAAGAPFWQKLRVTSGPLPTNDPGGTGEIVAVPGVILSEAKYIPGCSGDFSKITTYKNMWTDGTFTARSAVVVSATCEPECDACPSISGDLGTLYNYAACTSDGTCTGCTMDWEYNADCGQYELVKACGYGCTGVAPTVPDPVPSDRDTASSVSASVQATTCNALGDPVNPCCAWDSSGTCTPQDILTGCQDTLPRALGAATSTLVKAFQSSSMTIPAGMNVTLMPMGDYYAIVDWEQNLQCLMIPISMTCCPTTGNPIFDQYSRVIVQGYACSDDVNDC